MPMPPPPAPVLMEELVEAILLRFPPDDPATLVRAALVCKLWCRLVSGLGFRRRFREHHRTPPMPGFCYVKLEGTRFAPTTSFSRPRDITRHWRALDCRHGRVLLHKENWSDGPVVIWDPITDEKRELPILLLPPLRTLSTWSAAVFCSAAGRCDHLDCQRGAFSVVAAGTNAVEMFAYRYSSEVGAWSQVSAPKPSDHWLTMEYGCAPGALVANALYFSCISNTKILKYDLGTGKLSLVDGPPACANLKDPSVLMTTGDGKLGVVYVVNLKIHIWSSEVAPNSDARWVLSRVIQLSGFLPSPFRAMGSADGAELIIVFSIVAGLFLIDLKSGRVKRISKEVIIDNVIPFMSFYTPALGMASHGRSI